MSKVESLSLPSGHDIDMASVSQRELAAFVSTKVETQRIQFFDEKDQPHAVELPSSVIRLLIDILAKLSD